MSIRLLRLLGKAMAVLCAALGLGAMFFAPLEDLARNGRAAGGNLFLGLAAVFGESIARALVGAALLGLAVLFWRTSQRAPKRGRRAS
jgi:hypothetical protein